MHLFHEKWKLIIRINLTSTQERVKTIKKIIELTKIACDKNCTPQYEIQQIELRYNRLVAKQNIQQKLLGKQRVKRGLANFVGEISKTLFRTLYNSDLTEINNEFEKIYGDNKSVTRTLSNHTIIIKKVLDSSLINHELNQAQGNKERELASKISQGLNQAAKDSYVNSKLLMTALMIDETTEDMDTAINAISDGKHGIPHH